MSIYDKLLLKIKEYDNSIIAYSGGVDSSLLVALSHIAGIRFLPVTVISEVTITKDIEDANNFVKNLGIHSLFKKIRLLTHDDFKKNPRNRCYFCKEVMLRNLISIAKENGFTYILEGSNIDDLKDWRPGLDAIKMFAEVKSPFLELSVKKSAIRNMLKKNGIGIWNKSSSTCLATRIYFNTEITGEILDMVKRAEAILTNRGFRDVRVRTDGINASIEVNKGQTKRIVDTKLGDDIKYSLMSMGFKTVQIERQGYVSGRLNKV